MAPFNKKERPPPPLPSFSPEAGEQTLNYVLEVLLGLAGSGVSNPESVYSQRRNRVARTPAQSPDTSIPALPSGAAALLQGFSLPPRIQYRRPRLAATEYFRTSTHPEREPFENFVCMPRALSTSWAGPGHSGGRLRVSGISQCTGGEPPRKSPPPLGSAFTGVWHCASVPNSQAPIAPRARENREETLRSRRFPPLSPAKPCALVEGGSSGKQQLKQPHLRTPPRGILFLPHPRNRGAHQGDPMLHQVGSEPEGSPSSPPPQTRAQMHAHTHSPSSHHPEPLLGLRKSPPACAPKRSPLGTPGTARWGSEAPVLTLGLPTATAIATAAPAAPDCSLPTQAAASALAPAGLPRASLAAAPCSHPTPARLQPRLLAGAAPPALFQQHGLPPGLDH